MFRFIFSGEKFSKGQASHCQPGRGIINQSGGGENKEGAFSRRFQGFSFARISVFCMSLGMRATCIYIYIYIYTRCEEIKVWLAAGCPAGKQHVFAC